MYKILAATIFVALVSVFGIPTQAEAGCQPNWRGSYEHCRTGNKARRQAQARWENYSGGNYYRPNYRYHHDRNDVDNIIDGLRIFNAVVGAIQQAQPRQCQTVKETLIDAKTGLAVIREFQICN